MSDTSTDVVAGSARPRIDSLDLLRGLVMVIMALDHARDYFHSPLRPEALPDVGAGLFFTRWITHFCAPVFVFLAGTSAYLFATRGRTRRELSRYLLTRGLWLIVIELTVVRFGWLLELSYDMVILQVIWAIGASMVVLSALVWLPVPLVAAVGVVMIVGHNLLDGLATNERLTALWATLDVPALAALGSFDQLWALLHVQSMLILPGLGTNVLIAYPLVPWIGVMAVGYGFGALARRDPTRRPTTFLRIGLAATAAFLLLRALNGYGDPLPWESQDSSTATLIDFLNTQKYPPSLLFLLMTLGPAIACLAWFESARGAVARFFITIGRVPFLYYVLHIYLIHIGSRLFAWARFGSDGLDWNLMQGAPAPAHDLGLWVTYVAWAAVVLALYPVCRWFAAVKQRNKSAWLSYL
ncbi:MAG: DUF1624 domain-containing protein [Planctomycetota bacterium]